MPKNLPSILPSSKIQKPTTSASSGINRAQDLSVSKLQQQSDRESARVSIGQLMKAKKEEAGKSTTSVGRAGQAQASSSIERASGHAAASSKAARRPSVTTSATRLAKTKRSVFE